jgi:tetratricopeptide (TPR) repeat protein
VKAPRAIFVFAFLLVAAFTLATSLQPRALTWGRQQDKDNVLKAFLGDTRRLFANHLFVKADVTFHSGYYPSIFDQAKAPKDSRHMMSEEDHEDHHDEAGKKHEGETDHADDAESEHEREMAFLGPPKDWIERFGRNFMITSHTHLSNGKERELLPWLKLSAELDPQRIDTYTVSAYWLRTRLDKVDEAEAFLREGLRNNPSSYEILFELGRLFEEEHKDSDRARNLFRSALVKWRQREANAKQPNLLALEQILTQLAALEQRLGNYSQAVSYWELVRKVSPAPEEVEKRIQELHRLMGAPESVEPSNEPVVPGLPF